MTETSFDYSGRVVVAPITKINVNSISKCHENRKASSGDYFQTLDVAEGLAIEYVCNLGTKDQSNIVVAFVYPDNVIKVVNHERLATIINNGLEAEFLRLAAFALTTVTCEQEFIKAKQASGKN